MNKDRQFTLYWRTGEREVVQGGTIAKAMTLAGYGGGAVRALDFYAGGDDDSYEWNETSAKWDLVKLKAHRVRRPQ